MTQTIQFTTNERGWELESYLKKLGYSKVADGYWAIVFEDARIGTRVVLERV